MQVRLYKSYMTLREWLDAEHPGRGGPAWLVREAKSSFETIGKALEGEQINDRKAAERISTATGGAVSVAELMHIEVPKRIRKTA
jgi:hypothetical protein